MYPPAFSNAHEAELTSVGFEDLTQPKRFVKLHTKTCPAHFGGHQLRMRLRSRLSPARCRTESAAQQDPDRLATVFARIRYGICSWK